MNKNAIILSIVLSSFLSALITANQLEIEVTQQFFTKNQVSIVYVHPPINPQQLQTFQEFCIQLFKEGHACASLVRSSELHSYVQDLGVYEDKGLEYALISDYQQDLKYMLVIHGETTVFDIREFWMGYQSGKLTPYRSSEQLPKETNDLVIKLVADTVDDFMTGPKPLKVIFLYSQKPQFGICEQMLIKLDEIAEKLTNQGKNKIAYGFINVDRNEHDHIPRHIEGTFLIFRREEEWADQYSHKEFNKFLLRLRRLSDQEDDMEEDDEVYDSEEEL